MGGLFPSRLPSAIGEGQPRTPKTPRENSNQNLGVSRPKSTLQGSGLEHLVCDFCSGSDPNNVRGGSAENLVGKSFKPRENWDAANGGVTNGGSRGVRPPFLEIDRNRPFRAFSASFNLSGSLGQQLENPKNGEEGPFSSNILRFPRLRHSKKPSCQERGRSGSWGPKLPDKSAENLLGPLPSKDNSDKSLENP